MFIDRRFSRPLALACATTVLAVAPAPALALSGLNPPVSPSEPETRTNVVRESDTKGRNTLALILAGVALIVASGGARFAVRDHRRISHLPST
jgi:hypothetical protein